MLSGSKPIVQDDLVYPLVSSFPGLPCFFSWVCVQYNTWKRKSVKKALYPCRHLSYCGRLEEQNVFPGKCGDHKLKTSAKFDRYAQIHSIIPVLLPSCNWTAGVEPGNEATLFHIFGMLTCTLWTLGAPLGHFWWFTTNTGGGISTNEAVIDVSSFTSYLQERNNTYSQAQCSGVYP